jgi:hypothetical protein
MTAVIRFAEASFAASIMISSSITLRSTGSQPVWMRNTSAPRIDSSYRQYVSPFAKVFTCTAPSFTPNRSEMSWARSGFDRPANSISRF